MNQDLPDLSNFRILLAEDNITNQMVVTKMIALMGGSFEIASDGVEAIELFQAQNFDLAILDIEMPRKTGLDVIKFIREYGGAKSQTPIIALTAYVLDEHREKILKAGANGIIAKPLTDVKSFGATVRSYMVENEEEDVDGSVHSENIVDYDIYNGLIETIGKESAPELLQKVEEDLQSILRNLEQAGELKSAEDVRAQTHILTSVAGVIGAKGTSSLAIKLNQAAKSDDWEDIEPMLEKCANCIEELAAFVKAEYDKL